LLVMARQPVAGSTKTRLIPRLGPQGAADLYECFLLDALDMARTIDDVVALVAISPPGASEYFAGIAPDLAQVAQIGTSLDQRLDHVLTRCLDDGFAQVVAVNSDSPTLPAAHVSDAFDRLRDQSVDVVIGPADDGGYYLIGWKRSHPRLVRGVVMSTPDVLSDTMDRAEQSGLRISLLPPWYDVDDPADLDRLEADLVTERSTGRHSRRLLTEMSRPRA
jgi:hypothetical protein